ncbi:UxaA family hydrolase [Vibrio artabrorum]|uniref:Altronate dehydratase family protein n=1 Tax=Vibrio artabrorum TaxID=446374 RepID=A0ABT8CNR4_9VIBR|nr:altronate dehydratase family protein [Vibrio artabrorum]MDN3702610.1 altronate dehydratase family protein [Vibrio artabrorum]
MDKLIKINEIDNVAVALVDIQEGTEITVANHNIVSNQDIGKAQKVALTDLIAGENVIKYGFAIGMLKSKVAAGDLIDHCNIKTNLSSLDEYKYNPNLNVARSEFEDREINIYRRKNGDVGIRNELWIVPTVGCVNGIAKIIKSEFEMKFGIDGFDGINVLTHQYGCSQLGDDHETTKLMLQRLTTHPNAGGVLVIGLGCENNQITAFKETLGDYDEERVKFMVCQNYSDETEVGLDYLEELYERMKEDVRVIGKLSELNFGLECGGSDGLSGITANPMLGLFSDYTISHGGTTVLTEVPEMFGAETILMNRCESQKVFFDTVSMINNFKQYFIDHNQPIYENPSPGNKVGGISTLEEKSLGCTQKAGQSNVVDVLSYGDVLTKSGLNLLSAPGNDAIATTALTISGCHMVLFSTGRGTPYGGAVPTIKIATNSELANRKSHWIDFNAGVLVDGVSMKDLLKQFIDLIVDVANGKKSCNELNDISEIAVYKSGVTL